ncbi:hypothetical protein HMPREF9120_01595 [Neisseria sp. oral taxon 020 str. F0370]|nr:hypothetical protein HMPREF9120_01595 [Neisseria sp. oral taxon 020 str. F0370]
MPVFFFFICCFVCLRPSESAVSAWEKSVFRRPQCLVLPALLPAAKAGQDGG